MPNIERFIKTAELLEADAANPTGVKFDLGLWAGPGWEKGLHQQRHVWDHEPAEVPVSCGTYACAFGLVVLSGLFKDIGLAAEYTPRAAGWAMTPTLTDEAGRRFTDMYAAVKVYDISHDDAIYLFDPDSYDVTEGAEAELAVAQRIRDLVDGKIDKAYHPEFKDDCDYDDGE